MQTLSSHCFIYFPINICTIEPTKNLKKNSSRDDDSGAALKLEAASTAEVSTSPSG